MLASETRGDGAFLEGIVYRVAAPYIRLRISVERCAIACKGCTYGGRKNCSMSTYMPRNISSSKKYLAALSSVFSFSSQRFGRGRRKPGGGGPWGVAARAEVVEKRATVAGEGPRAVEAKGEGRSSADAGRLRASMLNGFVEAIVGCGGVVGGGRKRF